MAFKDQSMLEQAVFLIDKPFMAMGLHLSPVYLRLHHLAHGVAVAVVAVVARSPQKKKISQRFIVMQKGKTLTLPSLTLGRLRVSFLHFDIQKNNGASNLKS